MLAGMLRDWCELHEHRSLGPLCSMMPLQLVSGLQSLENDIGCHEVILRASEHAYAQRIRGRGLSIPAKPRVQHCAERGVVRHCVENQRLGRDER